MLSAASAEVVPVRNFPCYDKGTASNFPPEQLMTRVEARQMVADGKATFINHRKAIRCTEYRVTEKPRPDLRGASCQPNAWLTHQVIDGNGHGLMILKIWKPRFRVLAGAY